MAHQSVIDLVLNMLKKGTGSEDARRELQKQEKQIEKTTKASKEFNLKQLAGSIAIGAALASAVRFTGELYVLGEEQKRADLALQGYTGSAMAAREATDAVARAAGGAIDQMTAAQSAAKLFAMDLADSSEEAAHLTEIATTLGAAMGKGPQQAFEEFTLLLANQSILRLDTFGISGARVRTIMAEMAEETEGLTREQAFLDATMQVAEEKMRKLDAAGFEAANTTDKLNTAWTNLKLNLAASITDDLDPLAKRLLTMINWEQISRDLAGTSDTYDEFIAKVKETRGSLIWAYDNVSESYYRNTRAALAAEQGTEEWKNQIEELTAQLENADSVVENYQLAMLDAGLTMDTVKDAMQGELGQAWDDYTGLVREADESVEDFAARQEDAKQKIADTTQELIFQHASMGLNAEQTLLLARNMGLIDETTFAVASTVEELRQNYDALDGELDGVIEQTDSYVGAVGDLYENLNALPDEESIQIFLEDYDATAQVAGLAQELEDLPDEKQIRIEIQRLENVGRLSTFDPSIPFGGYQHGGSFTVDGPPGRDQVPVSFMASRGERVTIQPQGMAAPHGGGSPSIGPVYINNGFDAFEFADFLRTRTK